MPRLANRLSNLVIRQTKPDPNGKSIVLQDGYGLRLLIKPNGRRYFQFKSAAGGKERTTQIGTYPETSLEQARSVAAKLRNDVKEGRNPVAEMKLKKLNERLKSSNTFKSISEGLLEGKSKRVTPEYLRRMESGLRTNLYPVIGDLPIQSISSPLLREALARIEKRGSLDMLGNVRRWASEVFKYAKANGQFSGDNPADALLINIFTPHKTKHMVGLEWGEIPKFVERLDSMRAEAATIAAVKLLLLSGCRPGEVRGAKWEEIDWRNARWTIPAERMKMRRMRPQPHAVPLSRQAVELLTELKKLTGYSQYLFPARVGSESPCLTDIAILKAVKRAAGRSDVHAHGLRSTFSTHVGESLKWADAVKEAALAHGKRGVEGIYDRATHYQERVKLMQWYADELDKVVEQARILSLVGLTT